MNYDSYNREERYVCAHLFRLLHEPHDNYEPLRRFIGDQDSIDGFRIYAEVALIRDAYFQRRQDAPAFMDPMVEMVMAQEGVTECRKYSELPEDLRSPSMTHPGQIRLKGAGRLTDIELGVYGAVQGMFNAKPDLVVCTPGVLHVYEAKLTLGFDRLQLARTRNIAQVWAKLLHEDLGFVGVPEVSLKTLGLAKYGPDVSWEQVLEITEEVYPPSDRTRTAFVLATGGG